MVVEGWLDAKKEGARCEVRKCANETQVRKLTKYLEQRKVYMAR